MPGLQQIVALPGPQSAPVGMQALPSEVGFDPGPQQNPPVICWLGEQVKLIPGMQYGGSSAGQVHCPVAKFGT